MKNKFEWILLILLNIIFISLALTLSIVKHNNFNSSTWDLGIFNQAVWHWSRFENPIISTRPEGLNSNLSDNFFVSLSLLGPLYWVWNNPSMLLIFQSLIIALGGLGVYLLSKQKTKNLFISFLFFVFYWLHISTQKLFDFDFHVEAIIMGGIPWLFISFEAKKYYLFFLIFLILLGTKANTSIFLFIFGFYLLLFQKKLRWGIAIACVSAAWLVATIYIFIPHFKIDTTVGSAGYEHWLFQPLGNDLKSAFMNSINNPRILVELFFDDPIKIESQKYLFGSFGYLNLLHPSGLLLLFPYLAQKYYSSGQHTWGLLYHYNAPLVPIFIISLIMLIGWLQKITILKKYFRYLVVIIGVYLMSTFFYFLNLQDFPYKKVFNKDFYQKTEKIQILNEAIRLIPKNASVGAQNNILAHLTSRDNAYFFPWFYSDPEFIIFDITIYDEYATTLQKPSYNINHPGFGEMFYSKKDSIYNYKKIFEKNGILVYQKNL